MKTQRRVSATEGPAPNEYHPLNAVIFRNKLVTGEASFKSGSSRIIPGISCSHNPGPGYYSPNCKLTHSSSQRSSFALGSKRKINLELASREGPGELHYKHWIMLSNAKMY